MTMPNMIKAFIPAVLCLLTVIVFTAAAVEKAGSTASAKRVKRGKHLVLEGNCDYCHRPLVETPEGPVPDMKRRLSGHPQDEEIPTLPDTKVGSEEWTKFLGTLDSTEWAGPWGLTFSTNITPDPETGIGKWTEEIFIETMRSGKHVSLKRGILPPMPWQDYDKLSDEDLKSIFAYLMTLTPVRNAVPNPIPLPVKKR
jgi:mono/diheme cytochrome c family protein